ncbi:MAG: DUF3291 domain-containing protein [Gammaproteobacteria bacterium]|nr:DUF3291 domain-containing protein [Gammaproteobacteria bacterium]
MSSWELAQLNIATLVAPIESPTLTDFVAALDRINELADNAPGFVWRYQTDDDNSAEAEQSFGSDVIVNLSVWESIEQLHDYVYRTGHAQIMSRRKEWFTKMTNAYAVLWWVPQGHQPTPHEAKLKLELLRDKGPTADAFTFKQAFPNPGGGS